MAASSNQLPDPSAAGDQTQVSPQAPSPGSTPVTEQWQSFMQQFTDPVPQDAAATWLIQNFPPRRPPAFWGEMSPDAQQQVTTCGPPGAQEVSDDAVPEIEAGASALEHSSRESQASREMEQEELAAQDETVEALAEAPESDADVCMTEPEWTSNRADEDDALSPDLAATDAALISSANGAGSHLRLGLLPLISGWVFRYIECAAQPAQPSASDLVTHEVVEGATGDTELATTCHCPNCQPSYWHFRHLRGRRIWQLLTREDQDLSTFTSTDPLTTAWRAQARSSVPNASWFPQTEAVDTDPFVMNFGTRSGDWNVSPMDPRRHRESERVEAAGYVQGLLQRDFGSYGCRANIHGGPLTDGLAHDETEERTTFRWTTTVSQLPEEARAHFGDPRADSIVTHAQLRNALDRGLDQRTMVETNLWSSSPDRRRSPSPEGFLVFGQGFWRSDEVDEGRWTKGRWSITGTTSQACDDISGLQKELDEAVAADAEGDDDGEAWGDCWPGTMVEVD